SRADGNNWAWNDEWPCQSDLGPNEYEYGTKLRSSPASVSSGPNHIDVVARGDDFAIWHKWWGGLKWSQWDSLGGAFTSSPTIVSRGPNRVDIFDRGMDNALWM